MLAHTFSEEQGGVPARQFVADTAPLQCADLLRGVRGVGGLVEQVLAPRPRTGPATPDWPRDPGLAGSPPWIRQERRWRC